MGTIRATDTSRMEKVSKDSITAKISNMGIQGVTTSSTEIELRALIQIITRSSRRRRPRKLKREVRPSSPRVIQMCKRVRALNTKKWRLNRVLYKQIKNYRKVQSIKWPPKI